MKARHILILLATALMCGACERTLDFDGPESEKATDLVVNATAIAGSPLCVYVSRAYQIDEVPSVMYYDYQHAVLYRDDFINDYRVDDYLQKTAVKQAQVTAEVVNGDVSYQMAFDEINLMYACNYVPREGDRIKITVQNGASTVTAETEVPAKPSIEIISHEVLPEDPYEDMGELENRADTIMRLTCRISGVNDDSYYRLRVRSERSQTLKTESQWGYQWNNNYYVMQDIYFSEDDMFTDNRLTRGFGGWPAYFSSTFSSEQVGGNSRTFTLDSPLAYIHTLDFNKTTTEDIPEIEPRVMVELQAVSPDLYRYLKSMELYRISEVDRNAEPTLIHSNVKDGWGIFGSLSFDRVYIPYD